ncbi:AbrB/MazE/SpoVT family DNA-binding domain-containing protein [Escherichia coli]|uniref:AbrB/MazE/SpoVT family DNA-binding domain-containing protein n=1 Tax=Klebsiella pneumoniae TaxID=573 RepID=UPI0008597FCE|nr:transcriptional regulator [Klebsiella pneumoniae]HBV3550749.1 transcriptional regulator [Klebsiella pneumoniae]
MPRSRIDRKGRTTLPLSVRNALNLKPGDELAYQIERGRVVLTRVKVVQVMNDPFATFSEWDSEADHRAYSVL